LTLGHRVICAVTYRLTPGHHSGEVTRAEQLASSYRHTRMRLRGYGDALAEVGLGWETLRFFESGTNDPAGGAATTAELLRLDPPPTAILTDSDQLAIGALQAAANAGLRVPEDLSIVGMDDVPAAGMVTPALTTIAQPLVEKGIAAGEILLGRRSSKRRIVFPVKLVERGSTARPR